MRYHRFFKKSKAYNVLDYGAGNLRNAAFLSGKGFNVYAADLPEQLLRARSMTVVEKLRGLLETGQLRQSKLNVDVVISTFVLNIISDPAEKKRYLENIIVNLRPGGYLLIEVSCREKSKNKCCDCTKCPTCAKSYSREELDQLVAPYGFERLARYYGRHSIGVLYQWKKECFSRGEAGFIEGRGSNV